MEYRLTFKYAEKPSTVIERLNKYAVNKDHIEHTPVFTANKKMVHKIQYTLDDLRKLTDILTHYDMLTNSGRNWNESWVFKGIRKNNSKLVNQRIEALLEYATTPAVCFAPEKPRYKRLRRVLRRVAFRLDAKLMPLFINNISILNPMGIIAEWRLSIDK
jgi:hypothetical protein